MAPQRDRDKDRKAPRGEFGSGRAGKEPGPKRQRKAPQRQVNDLSDSAITAARHGEDPPPESYGATPREDRAG